MNIWIVSINDHIFPLVCLKVAHEDILYFAMHKFWYIFKHITVTAKMKKNYIRNVFVSISNLTSINIINANKQKKINKYISFSPFINKKYTNSPTPNPMIKARSNRRITVHILRRLFLSISFCFFLSSSFIELGGEFFVEIIPILSA